MPADGEDDRLTDLERQLSEIADRLTALEDARPRLAVKATPGEGEIETAFGYFGTGQFGPDRIVLQERESLRTVLDAEPELIAPVFAALASPVRVVLLRALLDGPRTSQELREVLDAGSVGQLYHHLRELLAAGLVIQPGRSVYTIPRSKKIVFCIAIIAAAHLANFESAGTEHGPETS